jgi:hypothetical protein
MTVCIPLGALAVVVAAGASAVGATLVGATVFVGEIVSNILAKGLVKARALPIEVLLQNERR